MPRPVTVTGAEPYTVDLGSQTVVLFVHDRKPMLARTDLDPRSPLDDGTVVAQYSTTKVYVNLGDVSRRTGPYDLGAYGLCAVLEDGTEITSEEIHP